MDVFLLWHVHELPDGEEDAKLIGVYSTPELIEQARQRAASLPGFREALDGFQVSRYPLDRDHWAEGYATAIHGNGVRQWRERNADSEAIREA